jgi:hypothetical protein
MKFRGDLFFFGKIFTVFDTFIKKCDSEIIRFQKN